MRYQRCATCFLAGLLTCFTAARPAIAAEGAAEPIKLSVLYVGQPQSERAKDFVAFLEKHFTKVAQADLTKFTEKDVEGYDAAIMDYGPVVVKNNRIEMPANPFAKTYSRPTLMLGATGGLMSSRMGLKTGYL
jgi:hypothetical protein